MTSLAGPSTCDIPGKYFLSKDPTRTDDPLAYRGLKITSAIYRRWASNRLHALDKWIATWDHDALHVVGGKGAQDAWLLSSLKRQFSRLRAIDLTGGSIDVLNALIQLIAFYCKALLRRQVCLRGSPSLILISSTI